MSRKGRKSELSSHFFPPSVCSSPHLNLKGYRKIISLALVLGLKANKKMQSVVKWKRKMSDKQLQRVKRKAFRERPLWLKDPATSEKRGDGIPTLKTKGRRK